MNSMHSSFETPLCKMFGNAQNQNLNDFEKLSSASNSCANNADSQHSNNIKLINTTGNNSNNPSNNSNILNNNNTLSNNNSRIHNNNNIHNSNSNTIFILIKRYFKEDLSF